MSTIQVRCPKCSRALRVDSVHLGRRGRCTHCGEVFPLSESTSDEPTSGLLSVGVVAEDSSPAGPANQASPPTELPEVFGRYRIVRLIGEGGMGRVYLARDTQLERDVALKVPHFAERDGPEAVDRFYREARAAATFDHPNLCPVFDVGQIDGVHYLTMPFLAGKPLSESIHADRPIPPRQVAAVVRKLATALQTAHERGIIHRDLKPSNIMATKHRELVIMDFGLARRLDQADGQLTRSGTLVGTPMYMAPEQVACDTAAIGPRSDIYSLGVILYELLTGRRPFDGPASVVMARILVAEPPRPSEVRPGVDPVLESICLRAMAKRPEDRFATMAELAAALGDHLAGPVPGADVALSEGADPGPVHQEAPTSPESLGRRFFDNLLPGSSVRQGAAGARRPTYRHLGSAIVGVSALVALVSIASFVLRGGEPESPSTPGPTAAASQVPVPTPTAGSEPSMTVPVTDDPSANVPADPPEKVASPSAVEPIPASIGASPPSPDRSMPPPQPQAPALPESSSYVDLIRLADQALKAGDRARAGQLLDACPGASRGWEWSYLKRHLLTRFVLVEGVPLTESESVPNARSVFSPDGARLAVSGRGSIRVWNVGSGALSLTLEGFEGSILGLAFADEGRRIVAVGADGGLLSWDAASGEPIRVPSSADPAPADRTAEIPPGATILSVSRERTIQTWNATTGESLPSRQREGVIEVVANSPDGRRIATADTERNVIVEDLQGTGDTRTLAGHAAPITGLAFAPDGLRLASVDTSGDLKLWDLESRSELLIRRHGFGLRSVLFTPDGKWIAAGGNDGRIVAYEATTGRRALDHRAPGGHIQSFVLSPDGSQLAVCTDLVRLYRVKTAAAASWPLEGLAGAFNSVTFRPDGKQLAIGSLDQMIQIFDVSTGQSQAILPGSHGHVYGISYSPGGTRLASATSTGMIQVWDLDRRRLIVNLKGPGSPGITEAYSPDGKYLASTCSDGTVWIMETRTGRITTRLVADNGNRLIFGVAFSPDGRLLATCGDDNLIKLWDAGTLSQIRSFAGHQSKVRCVGFSPDGRRIVSTSDDMTVRVWNLAGGREELTLRGHTASVFGAAFSPDGTRILSCGPDNLARLWDAGSGELLLGIEGFSAAFSPDGRLLAIGSGTSARVLDGGPIDPPLVESRGQAAGSETEIQASRRTSTDLDSATTPAPREEARQVPSESPSREPSIAPKGRPLSKAQQIRLLTSAIWEQRQETQPTRMIQFAPNGTILNDAKLEAYWELKGDKLFQRWRWGTGPSDSRDFTCTLSGDGRSYIGIVDGNTVRGRRMGP